MRYLPRAASTLLTLTVASLACAESLLPPEHVSLESLTAFRPVAANWHPAGGLAGDPRLERNLVPAPGTGVLVNDHVPGQPGPQGPLVTAWEHGDLDLELDYLIPPGSNSGVYLQGRYEVQIFDSWGVKVPTSSDNGGIYERWDDARGPGRAGYEGHAPKANASRAPGLWQHLAIEFRAPRFDAKGGKVANARFLKVTLNGFVVQQDVEVTGPTRSALFADEQPAGPLMIQGDHGPIAIRNLAVKRYGAAVPGLPGLHVSYFAGAKVDLDHYADQKVTREATIARLNDAVLKSDDRGVALITGTFTAPTAGDYAFRAQIAGPVRLGVDGREVFGPSPSSPQAGTVSLAAGPHALQLVYQHLGSWALRGGGLKLFVEGPGIAEVPLLPAGPGAAGEKEVSIPVEPTDRILLQRTFVTLEKSRRVYACVVGSPQGVHYAYDLEQAALIGVWRGGFFEGRDLWVERAEDQEARPTGPGFPIEGRPLLFQFGDHDAHWPAQAPLNSASRGYRLEANGQPVFAYSFSGVNVEDRIAPLADGSGLTRTLRFSGKPREREAWALLAEAGAITAVPGGYVIGDRAWYLDWPKDSAVHPVLRREGDRVQLLVKVTGFGPGELTYNLVW